MPPRQKTVSTIPKCHKYKEFRRALRTWLRDALCRGRECVHTFARLPCPGSRFVARPVYRPCRLKMLTHSELSQSFLLDVKDVTSVNRLAGGSGCKFRDARTRWIGARNHWPRSAIGSQTPTRSSTCSYIGSSFANHAGAYQSKAWRTGAGCASQASGYLYRRHDCSLHG